jgi:hypothetical protein
MTLPKPNNVQVAAPSYQGNAIRDIVTRVYRFYRKYGFLTTMRRSFTALFRLDEYKRQVSLLSGKGNEAVFSKIYESNLWVDDESRSGPGSTLRYTRTLREALPQLVSTLHIGIFIDAPCGDFNWMREVRLPAECAYVGVDIVPEMISRNQLKYGNQKLSFVKLDITSEPLPRGDIVFCRDCLLHLSFSDIFNFLDNFVRSEARYLMTTTHRNDGSFLNRDIRSGDVRLIDLFAEPFRLTREVVARVDDYIEPHPPREMVVWRREAIVAALAKRGMR